MCYDGSGRGLTSSKDGYVQDVNDRRVRQYDFQQVSSVNEENPRIGQLTIEEKRAYTIEVVEKAPRNYNLRNWTINVDLSTMLGGN